MILCALGAAAAQGPAQAQSLTDVIRATPGVAAGPTSAARSGAGPSGPGLFGSTELRSDSLTGLPQWIRVLENMEREAEAFERCLVASTACTSPVLRNWQTVIDAARGLSRRQRIEYVNNFFNRWPYKKDSEIYGRSEYWATPGEFMTRSGDCEDYSIAKYFALRRLGFAEDEMRIVILMDEIRGIAHAVLAIYDAEDILVLDSLSDLILSHAKYKHYLPQYSMNETTRWAHIGGFPKRSAPGYEGLVTQPATARGP